MRRGQQIAVRFSADQLDIVRAMPGDTDAERLRALVDERAELARVREAIRAELAPLQASIREDLTPTRQTVERLEATLDERIEAKMRQLWQGMKKRWARTTQKE